MSAVRGPVLRGRRLVQGVVAWRDGRIVPDAPRRAARLPDGWVIAPGLVDLQVNGLAGAEVGDDPGHNAAVAAELARRGVTSFCPTLVSRSLPGYRRALGGLAATAWPDGGARPLGVHLEGPFLAPEQAGAHPARRIVDPTPEAVERLLALATPRIVTLAPERPGALGLVTRLSRAGVLVSMGHTSADADAGRAAIAAGARMVTHALNAMEGLRHREPSMLAAALADPRVAIGLIADGVHVAPELLLLVARLCGPRLVLVSDAGAATDAPPGVHRLGETRICAEGGAVRVRGRAVLAGGNAPLHAGAGVLMAAGVPRAAALAAAAIAPRRAMGLPWRLAPGEPADLVLMDPALVPRRALVGGREAGQRPSSASGGSPLAARSASRARRRAAS